MPEPDLQILNLLASYVPENGNILEVGCFLGRSTYALYAGKPSSAHLEIVDSFKIKSPKYSMDIDKSDIQGNTTLINDAKNLAAINGNWLESFKHCITLAVADQLTINVVNSEEYKLTKHFDMVFIDANHNMNAVISDIRKYANSTTLLVGDDFSHAAPGVPLALSKIHREINANMLIIPPKSRIWIMVPPAGYWKEIFQKNIFI